MATSAHCSAKLFVDDELVMHSPFSSKSTIQSNIPGLAFTKANSTAPPAGGVSFTFKKGKVHKIRLEYQAMNLYQKEENTQAVKAEVQLFWNLVDQQNSIEKVL